MSGLQKLNRASLIVALSAYGIFSLAGCGDSGKKPDTKPTNSSGKATSSGAETGQKGHDDHDHHAHSHKGEMIEVGEELAHLLLNLDDKTGKLTATVLDAAGKNEVPVAMTSLKLQFAVGETEKGKLPEFQDLELKAVEAKEGKAADFEGTSDKLKGVKKFTGVLANLKIGDKSVDSVPIKYPSDHHH